MKILSKTVLLLAVLLATQVYSKKRVVTTEPSNSQEPLHTQPSEPIEPLDPSKLTLDAVRLHSTPASCWVVIHNIVHDLTAFIPRHPGGPSRIINACGTDASDIFSAVAYHDEDARKQLEGYAIGELVGGEYTWEHIAEQVSNGRCWVIVDNEVFDLSGFKASHPGGEKVIQNHCGRDGSSLFHGHPQWAQQKLQTFKVGKLDAKQLNASVDL
ncbi:hypothetical protein FGO68_gene17675 [Halteria grandinella]|uniref:Cytochrome b5 heme-binding domain-containing protein n=1 Tax=Halteria grandinella TaxID=5974 RepID=A0A8J8NJL7_HALGN|nr:hypothetical protein FGO68_gene17675 [Halteria grandinella]